MYDKYFLMSEPDIEGYIREKLPEYFAADEKLVCKEIPRAIPFCIATTMVPMAPPARALPLKAVFTIVAMAPGTAVIFVITMISASAT